MKRAALQACLRLFQPDIQVSTAKVRAPERYSAILQVVWWSRLTHWTALQSPSELHQLGHFWTPSRALRTARSTSERARVRYAYYNAQSITHYHIHIYMNNKIKQEEEIEADKGCMIVPFQSVSRYAVHARLQINMCAFAACHVLLSRRTIWFLLLKFVRASAVADERELSESSESELRRWGEENMEVNKSYLKKIGREGREESRERGKKGKGSHWCVVWEYY